eukprot:9498488-Pyramimonas_sp.AAC.1
MGMSLYLTRITLFKNPATHRDGRDVSEPSRVGHHSTRPRRIAHDHAQSHVHAPGLRSVGVLFVSLRQPPKLPQFDEVLPASNLEVLDLDRPMAELESMKDVQDQHRIK